MSRTIWSVVLLQWVSRSGRDKHAVDHVLCVLVLTMNYCRK